MRRSSTDRFQIPPHDIQVDESKKAAKPTLDLSRVVFHGLDESQKVLDLSQSYSTRMRAKELKRCLSSPIPSLFRLG
jgi:hypothetical protein